MQKAQPGKAWYNERENYGNCKTIIAKPSRKPDTSFREDDNPDLGGFRHSDTVVVVEDGIEKLTYYPRHLESLTI